MDKDERVRVRRTKEFEESASEIGVRGGGKTLAEHFC